MLQAAPLHKTVMAAIPRAFIVDRVCKDGRLVMGAVKTPWLFELLESRAKSHFVFEKRLNLMYLWVACTHCISEGNYCSTSVVMKF
jgi:hypothetical protein